MQARLGGLRDGVQQLGRVVCLAPDQQADLAHALEEEQHVRPMPLEGQQQVADAGWRAGLLPDLTQLGGLCRPASMQRLSLRPDHAARPACSSGSLGLMTSWNEANRGSSPQREAEQGAREGALQAAAKLQVGPEGIGELPQQVGLGEFELEPRLRRADAWQVPRMGIKQHQVLAAHKAAGQGSMREGALNIATMPAGAAAGYSTGAKLHEPRRQHASLSTSSRAPWQVCQVVCRIEAKAKAPCSSVMRLSAKPHAACIPQPMNSSRCAWCAGMSATNKQMACLWLWGAPACCPGLCGKWPGSPGARTGHHCSSTGRGPATWPSLELHSRCVSKARAGVMHTTSCIGDGRLPALSMMLGE